MTKDEFYDQISDFDDLIRFCEENDCYHLVDDVKYASEFDEWLWDQLEELRPRWFWHDLRNALNSIEAPSGGYFIPTGDLDYIEPSDSDLHEYIGDVLNWGDATGFWDDEEDDDEWSIIGNGPAEKQDPSDVCWDVSVDLSILIGV